MGVRTFFVDWWRGRQRRIDIEVLWPICRQHARNLPEARRAFERHAMIDPAWTCLGEEHVRAIIEALE